MIKRSLRSQLKILFISLAVLPLLLVGMIVGGRNFIEQRDQAESLQTRTAEIVRLEVTTFFNARENELRLLTDVRGFASQDLETRQDMLFTLLLQQNLYEQFVLLDAGGEVLTSVHRLAARTGDYPDYTSEESYTVPLRSQALYYSPVKFDSQTGEPLISISVPLIDLVSGQVTGVLIADFRIKGVWDIVQDAQQGDRLVYIVDADDRIIAHPNPSIVLAGETLKTDTDVIRVQVPLQLGNKQLQVTVEQSTESAFAFAFESLYITGGVVLLALLLAAGSAILTVRLVVRPIENLSAVTARISAGDLNQKVSEKRRDEIGTLGRSFNAMTGQLRGTIEELEKSSQEQRRLILELRDVSRVKDEFLAMMSHELRTPLNAILGFTGVLNMRGGLDARSTQLVRRVEANGQRLLHLINDILDLSRIESGRMEIVEMPISLRDFMDSFHGQNAILAEEKGLEFVINIDTALPERLLVDEDALLKVLTNLVSNAIKFTKSGSVTIDLLRNDYEQLCLRVIDTGIGIPENHQETIFERFQQVNTSSTREYGGSGLGLTIVKQFVEAMHGQVVLESQEGRGTSFTVTLPLKPVRIQEGETHVIANETGHA